MDDSQCFDKSYFNENPELYYYEDEYHINSCNKGLDNCKECEKETDFQCISCDTGYSFYNDNSGRKCLKTSEVSNIDYYLENDEYYSCKDNGLVENCKECDDQSSCKKCIEGYAFLDENKISCKKISDLGESYTADRDDPTIYKICSEYIDNCQTCESSEKCLSCKTGYNITNNDKCIDKSDQTYYQDPTNHKSYPCNNGVQFCEKCSSKTICNNCIDEYIILNSNYSKCSPLNSINLREYYEDPKNPNNYISCSSFVTNCDNCDYNGCLK